MADNMKCGSWAKKVKGNLDNTGTRHIWQNRRVRYASAVLNLINMRCNDIQRQTAFAYIREKSSSIFYCEMKLGWGREDYAVCCTRKARKDVG
jgi:hypothetical protein